MFRAIPTNCVSKSKNEILCSNMQEWNHIWNHILKKQNEILCSNMYKWDPILFCFLEIMCEHAKTYFFGGTVCSNMQRMTSYFFVFWRSCVNTQKHIFWGNRVLEHARMKSHLKSHFEKAKWNLVWTCKEWHLIFLFFGDHVWTRKNMFCFGPGIVFLEHAPDTLGLLG